MERPANWAVRVKNYIKGYSNVQTRVRYATSNDPSSPSTAQLSEIALMTYDVTIFNEILTTLYKRLNETGKNWRRVYKSLLVLEHCLNHGSGDIAIYFQNHPLIIQDLENFQYIDKYGIDRGASVREKAEALEIYLQTGSHRRDGLWGVNPEPLGVLQDENGQSSRPNVLDPTGMEGFPTDLDSSDHLQNVIKESLRTAHEEALRRGEVLPDPEPLDSSSDGDRDENDDLRNAIRESLRTAHEEAIQRGEVLPDPEPLGLSDNPTSLTTGLPKVHQRLCLFLLYSARERFSSRLRVWAQQLSQCSSVLNLVRSRGFQTELLQILSELGFRNHPEVQHAIQQDEAHLHEVMQQVLASPESQKEVLELDGEDVEQFMGLLQCFLERNKIRMDGNETLAQGLLLKIVLVSGKLPTSLLLSDVKVVTAVVSGGGSADIYRAQYQGTKVAVKRLRVFHSSNRRNFHKTLCKEVLVWKSLDHPYVLPFLGLDAETFPGFLCMVSPWMDNGTVIEYIRAHSPKSDDMNRWVFEIAKGLEYLHNKHIVHGDIRGDNIFVDDQRTIRIADFGLSRFMDITRTTHTLNGKGTLRWMAPELLFPRNFGLQNADPTYASDTYAFACTCLEMFSLARPFSDISHDPGVLVALFECRRPHRPAPQGGRIMSDELWRLVEDCWSELPLDRPEMADVIDRVQRRVFVVTPHSLPSASTKIHFI